MKILITTSSFGTIDPTPLNQLKLSGIEIVMNPFGRKLNEMEVCELVRQHQPVGILAGIEPLTEKVFDQSPNLCMISRVGTGLDSVDIDAASRFSITVCNTPDSPTIAVAELAVGMILCLSRMLHYSDSSIRVNKWNRPMGRLLNNKIVGIVGCGRVGSKVADYLHGFGCTLLGYDQSAVNRDDIEFLDLENLLSMSDIVTLHLPCSPETHNFIGRAEIGRMKQGSFLINSARGGIVDECALYEALESGFLGGAAIDCFEQEPYLGPLKTAPNVLLSAHLGSYAKEARVMMETEAVQNLIFHLRAQGLLPESSASR